MESEFTLTKANPKKTASLISRIFFTWLIKLFRTGIKRDLTIDDLYKPMRSDEAQLLGDRLEKNWNKEKLGAKEKNVRPKLLQAIKDTFFREYMGYGIICFVHYCLIRATQPFVLSKLLYLISNPMEDAHQNTIYLFSYGTILILQSVLGLFIDHNMTIQLRRIGMRANVACCSLLYRKLLTADKTKLEKDAAGKLINLLSNDTSKLDYLSRYGHYIWIAPLQLIIIVYLLYNEVQFAALVGFSSMIIIIVPIFVPLGKFIAKVRFEIATKTDYRVKLMNEIVTGIQVIKMYAWEKPFGKLVEKARSAEMNAITKSSIVRALFFSATLFIDRTSFTVTVVTYISLGNVISAHKMFALAQFFDIIKLVATVRFPVALTSAAEAYVTINRLEEFLLIEDKKSSLTVAPIRKETGPPSVAISVKNLSASWVEGAATLNDLTFDIPIGSLCAVVGAVGSGKSSLLQLLLGEMPSEAGSRDRVQINGKMTYSDQEAWLFPATARNNIIFGQNYDQERYNKIVKVCALDSDFKQFPWGDKSQVGERGLILSGGQRARINLARTIYRDADIYLLDDPLSAVDACVAKHIFDECISKYLRNKTRILVTHQLQFLKKVDYIIVLNEGQIETQGSYEKLIKNKLNFSLFLATMDQKNHRTEYKIKRNISNAAGKADLNKTSTEYADEVVIAEDYRNSNGEKLASLEYFRSGGGPFKLFLLSFLLVFTQVLHSGADYFMYVWTEAEESKYIRYSIHNATDHTVLTTLDQSALNYFFIYCSLIGSNVLAAIIRSLLLYMTCMTASKTIHRNMFNNLLKVPMRFFNINPSGRILNRFAKDMGNIDETLPTTAMESSQILLIGFGICVIIGILNPYMIGIMLVIGYCFFKLRSWLVSTSRAVKRLEGIAKSPVLSHINATYQGLPTIRSAGAEEMLRKGFDSHQDIHTSAVYLQITSFHAFGFWIDSICVLFLACVTYSIVYLNFYHNITASVAGLALMEAIILVNMMQYCILSTVNVVNEVTTVGRVLQYTKLDTEGPFETENDKTVDKDWPQNGQIKFNDLTLRYSKASILKNLNFEVLPRQKIGIVGRTGAGKSSIINALFRLAPIEGCIDIDGVDVTKIGLTTLRQNISIIPQEPVLFSASVRYNLDPFGKHTDEEIWNALEEVELKNTISSLDFEIEEGGSNLSVGQKQLLCLARAILTKNKILILDEATANVDVVTDSLIQKTIRNKCANYTVLTVAHRLNTIMDSDKILVIDNGRVVEFDHPFVLLQNQNGYFSRMVDQTGPHMAKTLKNIAYEAYNQSLEPKKLDKYPSFTEYCDEIKSTIFTNNNIVEINDDLFHAPGNFTLLHYVSKGKTISKSITDAYVSVGRRPRRPRYTFTLR